MHKLQQQVLLKYESHQYQPPYLNKQNKKKTIMLNKKKTTTQYRITHCNYE